MAVELVVGGAYCFLDCVVEQINIWVVFSFGGGVDTNLQEVQCKAVWFKFSVHMHFLDVESTLGVVILGLFYRLYPRLESLFLGHQIRDELDVVDDCYK